DQVRLALALPGPPREDIAHRRPGQPGRDRGAAGGPAHRPEAHRERDLAGDDRSRRDQDEPAEPLADGGLQPALYSRADPRRSETHAASSLREAGRSVAGGLGLWSPGGGSGQPPGCDPGHAIAAACLPQPKRAVGGRPLPAVPAPGYPPDPGANVTRTAPRRRAPARAEPPPARPAGAG